MHGEEPVVSIGKQRAARSATEWVAHDVDHPLLGPIRFAVQKRAVVTAVRNEKILSLVYVSCQKSSGKMAIELSNAPESDPSGGLGPATTPRLVCSSPGPGASTGLVKGDLPAAWEIRPLGDTLARDLSPAELRRCASIDVLQSVALPPGLAQRSQRIAIEITPYGRELDSVFTACGEKAVFAPAGEPPPAAAPAAKPAPEPGSGAAPWKPARTTAKGRTNVRAAASVDAAIVVKLEPGTRILVQQAPTASWWAVRPRSGDGFRGYVREDRLAFE